MPEGSDNTSGIDAEGDDDHDFHDFDDEVMPVRGDTVVSTATLGRNMAVDGLMDGGMDVGIGMTPTPEEESRRELDFGFPGSRALDHGGSALPNSYIDADIPHTTWRAQEAVMDISRPGSVAGSVTTRLFKHEGQRRDGEERRLSEPLSPGGWDTQREAART